MLGFPRSRCLTIVLIGLAVLSACSGTEESSDPPTSVPSPDSTSTTSTTSVVVDSSTSTTVPVEFDPYAGVNPGRAAIGTVTNQVIETPDGRSRHYRLYEPSGLGAGEEVPLLIALHGGLGSSGQFAVNSGFDDLAEANGFIVAYPDGMGALPNGGGPQTWNGGYCCGPAVRQGVDDVGFVSALIDDVEDAHPIDPSRVFVAGHSNGAIMAYRLACELSDRIVAIGVQAGSLGVDDCQPSRPVSVFHLHGLADTNHPIDGGVGSGVAGVEFRSARDAVSMMAGLDGCDPSPTISSVSSNSDLEISAWTGCGDGATVMLVTVAGATHAWMGHPAASAAAANYVGEPYLGFDASRAIWSFLAAHPRN